MYVLLRVGAHLEQRRQVHARAPALRRGVNVAAVAQQVHLR